MLDQSASRSASARGGVAQKQPESGETEKHLKRQEIPAGKQLLVIARNVNSHDFLVPRKNVVFLNEGEVIRLIRRAMIATFRWADIHETVIVKPLKAAFMRELQGILNRNRVVKKVILENRGAMRDYLARFGIGEASPAVRRKLSPALLVTDVTPPVPEKPPALVVDGAVQDDSSGNGRPLEAPLKVARKPSAGRGRVKSFVETNANFQPEGMIKLEIRRLFDTAKAAGIHTTLGSVENAYYILKGRRVQRVVERVELKPEVPTVETGHENMTREPFVERFAALLEEFKTAVQEGCELAVASQVEKEQVARVEGLEEENRQLKSRVEELQARIAAVASCLAAKSRV